MKSLKTESLVFNLLFQTMLEMRSHINFHFLQVCKQFNEIGWYLLNRGFYAAEKYQSASLKAVKLLLPRRESERRKHPLSKKCDILIAIETRLSMLSMAFGRFMEAKSCCFIPGKVIY